MTTARLLLQNLIYYWRTNLAVVLGVVAATAVIGGALVVGDSVRESLKQMSLVRLGGIDHAVHGGRFFREELASEFASAVAPSAGDETAAPRAVAPALVMQGTLERPRTDNGRMRAGRINVYGADQRLWPLLDHGGLPLPRPGQVLVNQRVAEQLNLKPGDEVTLIVEIPPAIPRDALLGDRDETVTALPLTVSGVADETLGLARLGLHPTQQLPANVFVSLDDLQSQTGLEAVQRTRRTPVPRPARVNALFISMGEDAHRDPRLISPEAARRLTESLNGQVTLEDLALRIVENEERGYLSLESDQMFLDEKISNVAAQVARDLNVPTSPVLVYLVNEIWNPADPDRYSTYSVIAGIDPVLPAPFGPLGDGPVGDGPGPVPLEGDRVLLNDWLAEDLGAGIGDVIRVRYHVVGDRGELPEEEHAFEVAGIVPLTGSAADPGFTPIVPGVTDADSYDDWREPFPLKRNRITDRDDEYWEEHRTTPKLFVSLETARDLWQSRYGRLTSLRIAPRAGESIEDLRGEFESRLLASLTAEATGLAVQPIKFLGLQAAAGTTDFTGLFLGFSFFLILAATVLVALLFQLGVERRIGEFGLLSAVGLPSKQVRRLFLMEGGLLVGIGGLVGMLAAVGYAALMIHGLRTWWYGAIGTRFLFLSVCPLSLLIGMAIAVAVALAAVSYALRRTRGESTRSLLSGERTETPQAHARRNRIATGLAVVSLGLSGVLLVSTLAGVIPDSEAFFGFSWRVVMFFLVGIGLLTGSLALLAAVLGSNETVPIRGTGANGRLRLGLRNAARNRSRSVMTASLIASATFVIVAVAAGQQNPAGRDPDPNSGNGGFTLVAETNVPILNDLNTLAGRSSLGFNVLDQEQMELLDAARVMPFRVRPGEDASCLNLYQTQLPTILGVPGDVLEDMIENRRFRFANTPGEHPWRRIEGRFSSAGGPGAASDSPHAESPSPLPPPAAVPPGTTAVPVLGDMDTLMYSLHRTIGDTLGIPSDEDPEHVLKVNGMFANSVFQGVLLMSEENFQRLFPEQVGFRYFLIEVDPEKADRVAGILEANLGDYGFATERVADRLANFLAVQNTYLSTFQSLGGLGLLLGTFGLATVMLRNVLERRGELALMRAVGFRKGQLASLVVWENAFLLVCGLAAGTVSALLAMSPHLISYGADVPWTGLMLMLAAVFLVGMVSALAAVGSAVATPILSTLRGD